MPSGVTNIAVVGGGIGGLSTAIMLRQAGIDVRVYEQAPAISEIGAGLGLFPNAMRVLKKLGLKEEIEARCVRQTHVVFRRWDEGYVIGEIDERGLEEQFGEGHNTIHRADLIEVLRAAVPEEFVHLGSRVTGIAQDDTGVRLQISDGSVVEADAVIAADGITSVVARELGVATKPVPSGFAVYRGLVSADRLPARDIDDDATAITVWLGSEKHFSHYWVRPGQLLNFMAVVKSPMQSEEEVWNSDGVPAEVAAEYRDWHPAVQAVLDAVETVTLFGLFHRVAEEEWHSGRVALIGDAVHPTLPFLGQGAAMAMEDAETLAVLLADASPAEVPALFELYTRLRLERARRCQTIAIEHGRVWNLADGPEQEERDARLAAASFESGVFFAPSAWLYAHDAGDAAREALAAHRAGAGSPAS